MKKAFKFIIVLFIFLEIAGCSLKVNETANRNTSSSILDTKEETEDAIEKYAQDKQKVKEEAIRANYSEILNGNWLNRFIYIEGQIESIESTEYEYLITLTETSTGNKYVIGLSKILDDRILNTSDINENTIKIYGKVVKKPAESSIPWILGLEIE